MVQIPLSKQFFNALLLVCSLVTLRAHAQVTVYGQLPLRLTQTGASAQISSPNAFNDTLLTPPPVPQPPPPRAFTIELQTDAANAFGLSIPHVGAGFYGFSIEMSVINQVLGKNSTHLFPAFLNLMSNLVERAGQVVIRLGGNTQEFATLVPELPDGRTFGKEESGSRQTTRTPAVLYTVDMFYMMNNISALLPIKWFLGIPFNDSVNWRLDIAEHGHRILGDNLLGMQAGNEPDFYQQFGRREQYSPQAYFDEVGQLIRVIEARPDIAAVKDKLIGPSIAQVWTPESVWETGFIDVYRDNLYAITVERYPDNNCDAMFRPELGRNKDPQVEFPKYLIHTGVVELVRPYLGSTPLAVAAQKPFMMFETNTASCGGFQGISDSYGAALWALDYGFQMAYSNFTHALLHVGGQQTFYNPFTSPPTNMSTFSEWTVGGIFYSTLILAETFGKSNTGRIVDLNPNEGNPYTPAYAIYENNALSKVALFNYVDDPSGASDLSVTIALPAGAPANIRVKYLAGVSVAQKQNISWAGQTFGNRFQVDGRLKGDLNIVSINCDRASNTCVVPVKAPGFAMAFINADESEVAVSQATQTFATTAHTRLVNTIAINSASVAASNGHNGTARGKLRSTSEESRYGRNRQSMNAATSLSLSVAFVVISMLTGAVVLLR